jgi:hypothetical protein
MWLRIWGFVAWLGAAVWYFRWEVVRSFLYDRAFHVMSLMGTDELWPIEPWPGFKKWDERQEFELYESACLWFNLEPRLPMPERGLNKYKIWRSQIFGGGIPANSESVRHAVEIGLKKENAVTPHTKIHREILVTMAEHEGAQPLYLFRHKRGVSA